MPNFNKMKIFIQPSTRFRIALISLAGILLFTVSVEGQPIKVDLRKLPEKRTLKLSEIGVTDVQYIPLETSHGMFD